MFLVQLLRNIDRTLKQLEVAGYLFSGQKWPPCVIANSEK